MDRTSRPTFSADALSAAVTKFRAGLTPAQASELSKQSSKPNTTSILAFTAEIDKVNADRRSRCVSSRLFGILQSVKEFSDVADTFVSAHPEIAALVWGSLKLTILVANNVLSFFDRLSEVLLKLGTYCPRYSEYQLLFADSRRLREALGAFYVSVVNFCTKAILHINQPASSLVQALWNPFEKEFKDFEDDLKERRKAVSAEIELASEVAAAKERDSALEYRKSGSLFRSEIKKAEKQSQEWRLWREEQRQRAEKEKILEKLSTYDHIAALKRLRKKRHGNTSRWLSNTQNFIKWREKGDSDVLWLSGIVGSGKSVITSAAVDEFLVQPKDANEYVSFFFCEFDNADSLKADTILGSLIRQCLSADTLSTSLQSRLKKIVQNSRPDAEDLQPILEEIADASKSLTLIIDGLDECAQADRKLILDILKSLLKKDGPSIKVLISSREDLIDEIGRAFENCWELNMKCDEAYADISSFIEAGVDEKLESGELMVGDPALVVDIKTALMKGAKGMFLWVAFQIQDLCRQTCDADIRTAIAKLPRDLPQTYNRLLSRISNSGKEEIVESIFRWVAATKRPLSLWELREAIAVRPEDIYLNRDRLINNPDGIANWCNNLVVMDEEEEIVQFAHHSIQQFLLSESSDQMTKRFHFSHADADFQAGEICVTYLNFNDFERQLALPPKSSILIQPTDIAKAATGGSSRLTKYLIHLAERKSGIKKPNGAGRDILHFKQTSNETKVDIHDIVRDQYPFLAYASEFWWTHSANLGPAKSRAWTLWKRLLPAENILARKPWIIGKDSVDIACVKGMILSENHLALAASVEDIGIAEADFVNVLLDSIRVENCQVVKSLLNTGLRINASVLALPEGTPFALACLYGNDEIVELFLKKGSEVNGRGELFGAPLKWATRKGHLSVVKLLLDNQADVDAEPKLLKDDFSEIKNPTWARQQRGGAALTIASTYGHTEIAELLINRGANVNRITQLNKECDTALKAASSQGHESIVKLLLDNGAKVDGPRYFTHHANLGLGSPIDALSFASANGNLGIVVRLLDKGAKIEYPWSRFTEFWCSALHAASACGSDSVVELLLQRGARINLPSPKGTALDLAKAFNHTSTAELLVLHGGEQLNPGENEEGDLTYYEAGIPVNLGRNIVGGIIVEDRHIMQEQRSYSSRTPR